MYKTRLRGILVKKREDETMDEISKDRDKENAGRDEHPEDAVNGVRVGQGGLPDGAPEGDGRTRRNGKTGFSLLLLAVLRGLAGPGLFSSLGVFFPAVAEAGGGSLGMLSLSVSLASVAGACFLPLAGRLYGRHDFRRVTLGGVLAMTAAYALYAVSPAPAWRALLSLPLGCGMVMLVNLMAPCYLRFRGADTGSSLGSLVALSGLTGAVFQPLLAMALAAWGWRVAYLVFGLGTLALMGGALLLLPPVAASEGSLPSRVPASSDASAPDTSPASGTGTAPRGAFISLFLYQGIITGFTMFHQHFSTFAEGAGLAGRTMTVALTLSMLTSAVGAFALGLLTRRYGAGRTGVGVLFLAAASVLLFGFTGGSTGGFLIAAALHGAASGAIGVTVPAAAREVYSEGDYARSLSRIMVSSPLFTLLFMQLYGVSYDRTGNFGVSLLVLLAALGAGAAIFSRVFGHRRERRRA